MQIHVHSSFHAIPYRQKLYDLSEIGTLEPHLQGFSEKNSRFQIYSLFTVK